jgi:dihydrofolate reductase
MGAPLHVAAIVAMDRSGLIGDASRMPWHLPRDLRRFRECTLGKPVLMGRKTFELIGRPLPGRHTIVLTRDPAWTAPGCRVARSLAEALALAEGHRAGSARDEVMVAGGGRLYAEAAAVCDRLYLTVVDGRFQGTVYFPVDRFGSFRWPPVRSEVCAPDERNRYGHRFALLERAAPTEGRPLADIMSGEW